MNGTTICSSKRPSSNPEEWTRDMNGVYRAPVSCSFTVRDVFFMREAEIAKTIEDCTNMCKMLVASILSDTMVTVIGRPPFVFRVSEPKICGPHIDKDGFEKIVDVTMTIYAWNVMDMLEDLDNRFINKNPIQVFQNQEEIIAQPPDEFFMPAMHFVYENMGGMDESKEASSVHHVYEESRTSRESVSDRMGKQPCALPVQGRSPDHAPDNQTPD